MVGTGRRLRAMLCGLTDALAMGSAAFADEARDLVRSLQLVVAPMPVKQHADWRAPHKVMLLEFGKQDWAPRQAQFAKAAPHTQIVVAHNMAEAIAAAPGTDALV